MFLKKCQKMIEFNKICRLCVSDSTTLTNIQSLDEDSVALCDKLKTVCDIQINTDDSLPTTICETCQEKLRQFYEFKLMVLQSNVLLNKYKKELNLNSLLNIRKKISSVFQTVDIKEEDSGESSAQQCSKGVFTEVNVSQNVIPLRKTHDEKVEKMSDSENEYETEFLDDTLELDVQEVDVLINWANKPQENASTSEPTLIDSTPIKSDTKTTIASDSGDETYILKDEDDKEESGSEAESTSSSKDQDYIPDSRSPKTRKAGPFYCHICDKHFPKNAGLYQHTFTHVLRQADDTYKCVKCDKDFTSDLGLRQHILRYSGDRPYKCDLCEMTFTDKPNLYNHKRKHSDERPYCCQICGKTFKFASCKRTHMKYHSGEKPFLCNICGKAFTLKITLKNHLRIHTGEKPFTCQICGTGFSDPSSLKSHHVKHTDGKPFSCDICFQDFKWEKSLKSHKKLHTRTAEELSEKRFSCELCGKMFRTKDSLNKHAAVHSDARPFKCDLCGKTFKFQSCWRTHVKYHGGKRVVCNICGKKYLNNSVLANHMRLHTGERPFKCDLCEKRFADNSTLRSHKIAHSNIKDQKCDYCGLEFKHRSYLMFHIKKKHPEMKSEHETRVEISADPQ